MKAENDVKKQKRSGRSSSPEKISAKESLEKIKSFQERKEDIIAFIKQSKD